MNKLIISIIFTILGLVVVLASPPTSIIGISIVLVEIDFNNTFIEIDLTNGQVVTEILIPSQNFLPIAILTQNSTDLLLIGNHAGYLATQNYNIISNEITIVDQISELVNYKTRFQRFGYDDKNNIVYDIGFGFPSLTMNLFILDFNTGLSSNITFDFPHCPNYLPAGFFDAPSNLYYVMYQDQDANNTLAFTYNVLTNETSTPIIVGITGLYAVPFVYNSMFFCGAVNDVAATLYAIDIASGATKSLVEQKVISYDLVFSPFVFDPNGYVVMIIPLQQTNDTLNVITFSLDSMSIIEQTKFKDNIPPSTFIMNSFN